MTNLIKTASQWGMQEADQHDLAQELALKRLTLSRQGRAFIGQAVRNKSLDFLRSKNRDRKLVNLDSAFHVQAPPDNPFLSERLELERIERELKAKSKKLLGLLRLGYSISEAGRLLEIPQRQAARLIQKIRELVNHN